MNNRVNEMINAPKLCLICMNDIIRYSKQTTIGGKLTEMDATIHIHCIKEYKKYTNQPITRKNTFLGGLLTWGKKKK